MRTYTQTYANPERSSLVRANPAVPTRLERLVAFEGKREDDSYPRAVLPAPNGTFALVNPFHQQRMLVVSSGGEASPAQALAVQLGGIVVSNDGYTNGQQAREWIGAADPMRGPEINIDTLIDEPRTMLLHMRSSSEQAEARGYWGGHGRPVLQFAGPIAGALSSTLGAVVVENHASKLSIYPPPDALPPSAEWQPTLSRVVVGGPNKRADVYEVSILRDGIALVIDATKGVAAEGRRDHDRVTWPSSVSVLDRDGNPRYRLDLPWSVAMPVIDAGPGRIALAGSHFVLYEDGKEIWRLDGGPCRATAFEDGSIAIAHRDELILIDRDQRELARLAVPGGELITTPPAVTEDGAIWLATSRGLFVAR